MDQRPRRTRSRQVSVGDALLAEASLRPRDEATRRAIARLLGADNPVAAPAPTSLGPWKPTTPIAPPAVAPAVTTTAADATTSSTTTTPQWLPGIETTLQSANRVTLQPPAWTAHVTSIDPDAGGESSVAPPPLFSVPHARALLTAVLSTFHDGNEIDTTRAANRLTRDFRLHSIPYRPVPSLRRGAQVLVDQSEAMAPFRDDVREVLADLDRLFGPGHLEVLHFTYSPSSGSRRQVWAEGRDGRRRPWRSPGRGVPVLVISDFTLSPPVDDDYATIGEWIEFARAVRAALCRAVALLPYPPERWPGELTRLMTFVPWTETTTARQVMRALRETRLPDERMSR